MSRFKKIRLVGNKKAPNPIAVKCSESTNWNVLLAVGDALWWLPSGRGEEKTHVVWLWREHFSSSGRES